MEDYQKEYVRENKSRLLEWLKWGTELKTYLHSSYALESYELEDLEDIPNRRERVWRLIEILIGKSGGYQILVDAADKSNQTGARDLLKQIFIPNPPPSVMASNQAATSPNILEFGENIDLVNAVIQKVRPEFIRSWTQANTNAMIIMQLAALDGVFDHDELSELVSGQGPYALQIARMTALFEKIAILSRADILRCLNRLCDMSDLPNISARNLEIFRKHFPEATRNFRRNV